MTQALVTGGTGFIGSHVVRRLLAEQVTVRCLARPGSNRANLTGLPVEIVEGDLSDPASLHRALEGCTQLFHVAADYRIWARHPEELERTNVEGTRHILLAAADARLERIVFTSSVAAVGRPDSNGHIGIGREELEPTPDQLVGAYKRTKLASDRLAREFAQQGLPLVIVNPAAPIGSHDIKPTPTGKMIVDFLNHKMPAYIDTGMNFVDVEDVATGHWLAAQKGRPGERYILGHRNMSLKEFLEKLAAVAGQPAPRIKIPYAVAWVAGAVSTGLSYFTGKEPQIPLDGVRMGHAPMYYDASKAVRELGLPQTPVESAIEKAVRWFRQNNYIRS
jgi:dihydroflavonol-4-reductase